MWFFITFLAVIALLVIYLHRRGATGAGDHFARARHEADMLPYMPKEFTEIKKKR
ncbi:hypothetical protein N802_08385 [Knoellia sinensis KCTC 19936]|uniref:Uncharacterized protein n=1 Tax=Knoellia sinensis KCTC 19936 TaxID=1385520 RepID=A0A0A0J970_9MICO|nr:hypothetical protein [Knoellia sinensis]KGN33965.1 hypothetical protein N802_08385 [Knoellia sinensis KCTC 19936]